ncbi:endolytic transglycosylase MltG [Caulobacter sp. 17J65-9]|uniref:endolytic transglycosylase MltG n=1 Tax=Caulobacter sp. 17J65-9 TaxID=2709382 RepID=UPI0013C7ED30|nr:endolytic transglycosylase MltG [Caulobacter sp. 17J65-9]
MIRRSNLLVSILSGAATIFVGLVLASVAVWFFYWGPGPKAPHGTETVVVMRDGAGVSEIAAKLEREGVIRSADLFKAAAQITKADRRLKAGEYVFPSRAPLTEVLRMMRDGEVRRWFLTVPEGRSVAQAMDLLNASPVLVGTVEAPAEGSLLPETYELTRGESRAAVLKRMQVARDVALAELWAKRQAGLPLKSPEEAVILASIVEKETGLASERPKVAAVFVNRLNKGMRLESDPTLIYPVTKGRPLGRGIRLSEKERDTPYNTYLIAGLPPTPITNPGRDALAAVLNPPKTQDLFFVADGTGGHVFAASYDQHLKNVAQWRRIEADRAKAAAAKPQTAVAGAPAADKPL